MRQRRFFLQSLHFDCLPACVIKWFIPSKSKFEVTGMCGQSGGIGNYSNLSNFIKHITMFHKKVKTFVHSSCDGGWWKIATPISYPLFLVGKNLKVGQDLHCPNFWHKIELFLVEANQYSFWIFDTNVLFAL